MSEQLDPQRMRIADLSPVLMLVTDASSLRGRKLQAVVRAAVDGGANVVQARKDPATARPAGSRVFGWQLPFRLGLDPELEAITEEVSAAAEGRAMVSVNNDIGIAMQYGAALHLPERARNDCHERRAAIGLLSRSVHGMDAARAAVQEGVDYLVLGTVFPSGSHAGGPTIGIEGVRAVCDGVAIPVLGIGGITAENAGDVIRAGAAGVAVISAIFDAPDPQAAAAELRVVIDEAWQHRDRQNENLA